MALDFKKYLEKQKIKPIHGCPGHPQTQGKIERYHRSMKNVIKLDIYYSPMELEHALKRFVEYYNHQRYHESLQNLTPAHMYFGRATPILEYRKKINKKPSWKERENITQQPPPVKFILTHFRVIKNPGKCMSEINFTMLKPKSQNFNLSLNQ